MKEIKSYCQKIENYPGGFDYFFSWVKYGFSGNSETRRIQVVHNYFEGEGYDGKEITQKPSKKSEKTYKELANRFLEVTKDSIEDDLNRKIIIRKELLHKYLEILKLPGGYFFFYGWLRATHGEKYKKLTKEFLKRYLENESSISRTYIIEYQKLYDDFNSLSENYFQIVKENGYKLIVDNIPQELIISFQ